MFHLKCRPIESDLLLGLQEQLAWSFSSTFDDIPYF